MTTKEIKNAKIESTRLGVAYTDHGILSFMISLDYGGASIEAQRLSAQELKVAWVLKTVVGYRAEVNTKPFEVEEAKTE